MPTHRTDEPEQIRRVTAIVDGRILLDSGIKVSVPPDYVAKVDAFWYQYKDGSTAIVDEAAHRYFRAG
jgi:hypothetical protein